MNSLWIFFFLRFWRGRARTYIEEKKIPDFFHNWIQTECVKYFLRVRFREYKKGEKI